MFFLNKISIVLIFIFNTFLLYSQEYDSLGVLMNDVSCLRLINNEIIRVENINFTEKKNLLDDLQNNSSFLIISSNVKMKSSNFSLSHLSYYLTTITMQKLKYTNNMENEIKFYNSILLRYPSFARTDLLEELLVLNFLLQGQQKGIKFNLSDIEQRLAVPVFIWINSYKKGIFRKFIVQNISNAIDNIFLTPIKKNQKLDEQLFLSEILSSAVREMMFSEQKYTPEEYLHLNNNVFCGTAMVWNTMNYDIAREQLQENFDSWAIDLAMEVTAYNSFNKENRIFYENKIFKLAENIICQYLEENNSDINYNKELKRYCIIETMALLSALNKERFDAFVKKIGSKVENKQKSIIINTFINARNDFVRNLKSSPNDTTYMYALTAIAQWDKIFDDTKKQ